MILLYEISPEIFHLYSRYQKIIDYGKYSHKYYKIDIENISYVFAAMSDMVTPIISSKGANILVGIDLHVFSISKTDKRVNFLIELHEYFLFFLDDYDVGFDIVTQRCVIEVEGEELVIGSVRFIPDADLIDSVKRIDDKFLVTSIEGNVYTI